MDAIDRLRESARNERTCLALNQVLRLKDDEIRSLQKRVAELEAALKTMVDNFGPTPSEKVKGLAEARAALKGGA